MTFPKRDTREITINDIRYVWHLNGNDIWHDSHITIRHASIAGQILYLDPMPWDFAIRPRTIREGILWALQNNWQPTTKALPLYVGYRNNQFIVLPKSIRFTHE